MSLEGGEWAWRGNELRGGEWAWAGVFLPGWAGQEASDVHPMWTLIRNFTYKRA